LQRGPAHGKTGANQRDSHQNDGHEQANGKT